MTHPFSLFAESYETERLKTLSVWAEFRDDELAFRPAPLARTPHEHMVHQCVSEQGWMIRMLGIDIGRPELPPVEDRLSFLRHYDEVSRLRREVLDAKEPEWFGEPTTFFDVPRTRAWVLTRRLVHSAHHRAQLTVYLRLLDRPLYSTYGPTADTGGLFQHQAPVIYRYPSAEALLEAEAAGGGAWPDLPGPGPRAPTERP
ncbi:MAG: damage-inducible protein DinB [Gemmatimonadetes bacterium]|nr:damage-inducible protein DinB [Gemmatimonadota bacterium]